MVPNCSFTLPGDENPMVNQSCLPYSLPDTVRYLDVAQNEAMIEVIKTQVDEQINQYGILVDYIKYNYSLTGHNFVFGEETTANYEAPVRMIALVKYVGDTIAMANFGIVSDAQAEFTISIKSFETLFGSDAEPKSGDLISVYEASVDRPNGRGPQIFEITKRQDQAYNSKPELNVLMSHTAWWLTAKRFEYASQRGISAEAVSNQVNDDIFNGRTEFTSEDDSRPNSAPDAAKVYTQDVDTEMQKEFDIDEYGTNTDIYGGY